MVVYCEGLVYVIGNNVKYRAPSKCYIYNPSENTWTSAPDLDEWNLFNAVSLGGCIYLTPQSIFAPGHEIDNRDYLSFCLETKTQTWKKISDVPPSLISFIMDNQLCCANYVTSTHKVEASLHVYRYDEAKDKWDFEILPAMYTGSCYDTCTQGENGHLMFYNSCYLGSDGMGRPVKFLSFNPVSKSWYHY